MYFLFLVSQNTGGIWIHIGEEQGHRCIATSIKMEAKLLMLMISFLADGRIREHYVRINSWPQLSISRRHDWGWEMSNGLYLYSSVPDTYKPDFKLKITYSPITVDLEDVFADLY
uniref:Uncharacterized protein n=1 Tax=Lactuca sativa TaxID=4236 RepID=A0A9R1WQL8_LACSA|nr:hypothetical protein LSAT_V11C100029270 [Lactuca sativa]